MKLIVGLGNPGKRYDGTRHNVGFDVIDLLAKAPGVDGFASKFKAEIAEAREGDEKVLLVKPQTFMNLSGQAVRQICDFYHADANDVLVICDDVNLPLGKLRFRTKGTHGGHNGLRDVQAHLGTTEYSRLRIGVGGTDEDLSDHVLGRFRPSEQMVMADAELRAAQAAALWIRQGAQACMNQYNG